MIIFISIALICIGCWLLYLNHVYASVDPLFQLGFICFTAAVMLICGCFTAERQFSLAEPYSIIFPIYLLLLYVLIWIGIPKYTYKEACSIIEMETGKKIYVPKERSSYNGHYYCYSENNCYMFNPQTGYYSLDVNITIR